MNNELTLGRPAEILLVEDNDNDVELTRQGFKLAKLAVHLHHVWSGEACLAFLRRQGAHTQAPRPDLILLDLNMPRMDGRAVLAELVADEALRYLPVVILTTSAEEQEVLRMYQLRCSSYIVKPVDFDEFLRVIRVVSEYWFTVVALPVKS